MLTIESISAGILSVPPLFERAISPLSSTQLSFKLDVLPHDILIEVEGIEKVCGNARRAQRIALGFEAPGENSTSDVSSTLSTVATKPPRVWSGNARNKVLVRPQPMPSRRGRRRIHEELPPIDPNGPPVTVYQRLQEYGLLRKVTDIVLAKTSVPWNLREDAAQEVHMAWLGLTVKPQFVRNQLAKYAYMSGQHAALKLRRSIGAVVSIPGVLFRAGNKHPFMESIGAAVNPHDIDEFHNNVDLSLDHKELEERHMHENFFEERIGHLELTAQQRKVAHSILVQHQDAAELADEMGVTLAVIERLVEQVAKKLQEFDSFCVTEPAIDGGA